MYLLDTNICIDFVDGRSKIARERVRSAFGQGLSISSVTAAELLVGARSSTDPVEDAERVERFLATIRLFDFDEAAARSYADLARAIGVRRRSFDRLIAAHARSLNFTLVTNNAADFAAVPGLNVENWTLPP